MKELYRQNVLVVERLYDYNDEIIGVKAAVQRIKDVPNNVPINDLKELLDQLGYSNFRWGLHTIMPEDEWGLDGAVELYDDLYDTSDLDYEELVDRLNGEKRITLRLPYTLHYALSQKAGRVADKATLNSYCIKVLAESVDYGEELEKFESSRRKPGRPKKVQNAE